MAPSVECGTDTAPLVSTPLTVVRASESLQTHSRVLTRNSDSCESLKMGIEGQQQQQPQPHTRSFIHGLIRARSYTYTHAMQRMNVWPVVVEQGRPVSSAAAADDDAQKRRESCERTNETKPKLGQHSLSLLWLLLLASMSVSEWKYLIVRIIQRRAVTLVCVFDHKSIDCELFECLFCSVCECSLCSFINSIHSFVD